MDEKCKEFDKKEEKAAKLAKAAVPSYSRPVSVSLNSSRGNWKEKLQSHKTNGFRVITSSNSAFKNTATQMSRETLGASSKDKYKSSRTPSQSEIFKLGGSSNNSLDNSKKKLVFPTSIPEVLSQDPDDSEDETDIDQVLAKLKLALERVYNLPNLLKDLTNQTAIYKDPLLDALSNQASLKKVQELKSEADQLYRRFFKSKKYLRLLAIKVSEYIEEQSRLLPVDPKKARDTANASGVGSQGNLSVSNVGNISKEHIPAGTVEKTFLTGAGVQQPVRPKMLSMESLTHSKMMEKASGMGSKSKIDKINLKDLLQQEKKIEEFQKRKQIVNSTSRNIITQPLRDVLKKQIQPLELVEEKAPSRIGCVFNSNGRTV